MREKQEKGKKDLRDKLEEENIFIKKWMFSAFVF